MDDKDRASKFNKIREALKEINESAKVDLLKCLAESEELHIVKSSENGLIATTMLETNNVEVTLKFNVDRKGALSKSMGAAKDIAKDIKYLRWIPVCCECGQEKYYYRIDLLCQDLDTDTGNFHINPIGGLQIWRDLMENSVPNPEAGGSITAIENLVISGKHYGVHYFPEKAFPVATRANTGKMNNINEDRRKEAMKNPWGYNIDVPELDMSNENFVMQEVANFLVDLILKDLNEKLSPSK